MLKIFLDSSLDLALRGFYDDPMAFLSSQKNLSYGPSYLARGLFVSLLVPMTVMAMQWRPDTDLELPEFITVWFVTWICSLLLNMKLSMRRWASYSLHWVVYLGASSLFIYEWRIACLLQGLASLLWWALFDTFERLYSSYKAANESMERAKVLEARIRPHFVFNVLNSLRAMSDSSSVVARALDDSADLLRSALVRTGTFVGYCDERALVDQYLRLEALRLEDRLDVQWSVDDDVEDDNPWMPGFIIQPIVENAIRHGVELYGGPITIDLRHAHSYLILTVSNDCPAEPDRKKVSSPGLGLAEQDIMARLELIYDEHAQYKREFFDGKCRVTIRFPWRLQ